MRSSTPLLQRTSFAEEWPGAAFSVVVQGASRRRRFSSPKVEQCVGVPTSSVTSTSVPSESSRNSASTLPWRQATKRRSLAWNSVLGPSVWISPAATTASSCSEWSCEKIGWPARAPCTRWRTNTSIRPSPKISSSTNLDNTNASTGPSATKEVACSWQTRAWSPTRPKGSMRKDCASPVLATTGPLYNNKISSGSQGPSAMRTSPAAYWRSSTFSKRVCSW
mmetsp:Transcript_107981/g.311231  ORF Transcript_107981/g.311231 Transcript_107981/m.311231 type:complete len:222 (+) Transcript_107981:1565-2230(+)